MGLDKWLKSDDIAKESTKKKESSIKAKRSKGEQIQPKELETQSIKLTKYVLVCPNAKCKYQKTIIKKQITDEDKTCPRCKTKMKIKEL
ncbi:MAG: hypothetical protein JSV23_10800 [Promethearchaeota archaeon]|nr:MAG: hypothetical protein JSV23_10800 [Candidatus Lokiarchaeota archaeon]